MFASLGCSAREFEFPRVVMGAGAATPSMRPAQGALFEFPQGQMGAATAMATPSMRPAQGAPFEFPQGVIGAGTATPTMRPAQGVMQAPRHTGLACEHTTNAHPHMQGSRSHVYLHSNRRE